MVSEFRHPCPPGQGRAQGFSEAVSLEEVGSAEMARNSRCSTVTGSQVSLEELRLRRLQSREPGLALLFYFSHQLGDHFKSDGSLSKVKF